MKQIIQRNLSLTQKYSVIDKQYISLVDGFGCTCDNCGKLIANIATVRGEDQKSYSIGFDCLETFLINNSLLDGKSIEDYLKFKSSLPTFIKHSKEIKESIIEMNKVNVSKVVSVQLEVADFKHWAQYGKSSYLTYYYIFDNGKKYNINIRLKNTYNVDDFISVFKSINNKINVILN